MNRVHTKLEQTDVSTWTAFTLLEVSDVSKLTVFTQCKIPICEHNNRISFYERPLRSEHMDKVNPMLEVSDLNTWTVFTLC